MAAGIAWVLNLDADLELGAGTAYEPSKSLRLAMKPHVARLAATLLGADDVLVDDASPADQARGLPGRAFCPTPRAIALLERAGARPEPYPDVDVLRRVNSRAFASSLGSTLPDAAFVTELEEARTKLLTTPPVGTGWRVKHAFGVAGRHQRVIIPSALDARGLAFLRTGLAQGGVQIEPNVAIEDEYAMHGLVARDGALRLGDLVRQRCDGHGAWLATERLSGKEGLGGRFDAVADECRSVARALHEAGYFGPFGIDVFTYHDPTGALCLQPRSEINARYSMGFAVGFGGWG